MDNKSSYLLGILINDHEDDPVGTTKIKGYTIDTCFTSDQGYETSIWFDDNICSMVIVQRYTTRNKAVKGHKKWIEICKNNAPTTFQSVQDDQFYNIR